MSRQIVGALLFASIVFSQPAQASKLDDDFEEILFGLCEDIFSLFLQGWDSESLIKLNSLCLDVLPPGTTPSSDYNSSSNIGSSGANGKTASSTAQLQVDSVKDRLAAIQEEEAIDQGGFGMLLAVQNSETEREETDNESGYESDLEGVLIGGDYRFNNRFIAGIAFGRTTDTAEFDGNSGDLDTTNETVTAYVTFMPTSNSYIDAYFGEADLSFESKREIDFPAGTPTSTSLNGTARGDYDGEQSMAGISAGYDWYFGNLSIGAFAAYDVSDTDIDGYDEDGDTGLEFSYEDQEIESELRTIGVNLAYDFNQSWGVLSPTFSVSSVHQSKDDTRDFALQPSFVPFGTTTPVEQTTVFNQTDEPDRDYVLSSVGLIALLNNGAQLFVTYEQMSSHDFLDTWSLSAGVLIEAF